MKRILLLSFVFLFGLAGCASQTQLTPTQIITQINTQVCPVMTAALTVASTLPQPTPATATALADVAKINTQVCAAGAQLNSASLQTLVTSALPVLLGVVEAAPVKTPEVTAAIDGITIAQAVLPLIIAQVKANEAAAPTSTVAK
jgi:hypothetical protein